MPLKEDSGINYRAFIALGASIMGLGITLSAAENPAFISFIVCGAIFMIIGARAKWAEKEN
jgi:predicted membrane channel-forming protein YqfA (hemolysin III family)